MSLFQISADDLKLLQQFSHDLDTDVNKAIQQWSIGRCLILSVKEAAFVMIFFLSQIREDSVDGTLSPVSTKSNNMDTIEGDGVKKRVRE